MPSDDLVEFLTLMIGAAVIPAWVIIVLLFLRGQDGLRQALAFVGGTTLVRLMQGLFFGMTLEYCLRRKLNRARISLSVRCSWYSASCCGLR